MFPTSTPVIKIQTRSSKDNPTVKHQPVLRPVLRAVSRHSSTGSWIPHTMHKKPNIVALDNERILCGNTATPHWNQVWLTKGLSQSPVCRHCCQLVALALKASPAQSSRVQAVTVLKMEQHTN